MGDGLDRQMFFSVFPWFHSFCRLELTSQFAGASLVHHQRTIGLPEHTCHSPPALSSWTSGLPSREKIILPFANINSSLLVVRFFLELLFPASTNVLLLRRQKWHFPHGLLVLCASARSSGKLLVHGQERSVGGTLMNLSLGRKPAGLAVSLKSLSSSSTMPFSQSSQRRRINSLICSAQGVPFLSVKFKRLMKPKNLIFIHIIIAVFWNIRLLDHTDVVLLNQEICEFCCPQGLLESCCSNFLIPS